MNKQDSDDTNDEVDEQAPGPALEDSEHYFPAVDVHSDGRLGLDTERMKRYGFEVGERIDIALPDVDLYVPDVKLQTQFRVQIPARLRDSHDIEEDDTLDVFVIHRNDE